MQTKTIAIVNRWGVHARSAAKLAQLCGGFASKISVCSCSETEGQWVDAKSIMALMLLAAGQGIQLKFQVEGEDEEQAMEAIEALIQGHFGEEE